MKNDHKVSKHSLQNAKLNVEALEGHDQEFPAIIASNSIHEMPILKNYSNSRMYSSVIPPPDLKPFSEESDEEVEETKGNRMVYVQATDSQSNLNSTGSAFQFNDAFKGNIGNGIDVDDVDDEIVIFRPAFSRPVSQNLNKFNRITDFQNSDTLDFTMWNNVPTFGQNNALGQDNLFIRNVTEFDLTNEPNFWFDGSHNTSSNPYLSGGNLSAIDSKSDLQMDDVPPPPGLAPMFSTVLDQTHGLVDMLLLDDM